MQINTSLKSYLYVAVQNQALNYLQQQKTKQKYLIDKEHLPSQPSGNGQLKLEEEELKKVIKNAILSLPEKRRKIFELSRFENMKYNQIAEHLSISVKTVEAQMSKSLHYLRIVLKDYLAIWILITLLFS